MTRKIILAALAATALASPALAGSDDKVFFEQYQGKIAAAKADPAVMQYGGLQITRAQAALDGLKRNLKNNDERDVRATTAEIDALLATAKIRAEVAAAKGEAKTAEAARADRLSAAEEAAQANAARASAAEAQARAAQAQNSALRDQLKQTAAGATLVLQDVIFQTGRAELRPGAIERLRPMVGYLKANANVRVRIAGHTDSQGSDAYNRDLSQRRAEAVRAALASTGIDPSRIDAVGEGESRPVATNVSAAGRQANRRVEITLIGQKTDQLAAY